MFIKIVEASELRPELSLRASDYISKDSMTELSRQRMETGLRIDARVLGELIDEEEASTVGSPVVDQLWETRNVRRNGPASQPFLRRVRIIAVGDTHAVVENVETGHRTYVRLKAFGGKSTKDYQRVVDGS